jgi:hypothetical protein
MWLNRNENPSGQCAEKGESAPSSGAPGFVVIVATGYVGRGCARFLSKRQRIA